MPRVIHFEISADDPERANKFYSDVFGWTSSKWDGPVDYWMLKTGEGERGINGGLVERNEELTGTVNTIDVPSIDEYLAKITAHGGEVVMPKTEIPGVGCFSYCKDTEGNLFGIMEFTHPRTH